MSNFPNIVAPSADLDGMEHFDGFDHGFDRFEKKSKRDTSGRRRKRYKPPPAGYPRPVAVPPSWNVTRPVWGQYDDAGFKLQEVGVAYINDRGYTVTRWSGKTAEGVLIK
jgi:hypothetical protein